MDTSRVIVYSPQDTFLFELSQNNLYAGEMYETINGKHTLVLVTTTKLEKEQRIIVFDATGKCREYVVTGEDAEHQSGERMFGTYQCIWSLQHDMSICRVNKMPGTQTPVLAQVALDAVLSGTNRWKKGIVDVTTLSGASMYQMSAWEAMSVLVQNWGGEVDSEIEVDTRGVVSRKVNLRQHLGSSIATRRFDYTRDIVGIRRTVDESAVACRIVPRGRGEETGEGYGRKITIEEVNDGLDYLQNDASAEVFKLPDGNGGYEYPVVYVDNGEIDDPQELKDWGLSVLNDYTVPKVTYQTDVSQFAAAGMDVKGVELGDATQCVDKAFGDTDLRIEGRVIAVSVNLKDPTMTKLTLGYLKTANQTVIGSMMKSVQSFERDEDVSSEIDGITNFLENLIQNLNRQINATGGYTYITQGDGFRTYDKAVTNPNVGAEADAVVEIKGGAIRIANSRTATGEWDWKSVFVSGHIATEMITSGNITTGYIGNPNGTYWNLDTGVLSIGSGATINANTTVGNITLGTALNRANAANKLEQLVYRSVANNVSPGTPGLNWNTNTTGNQNVWTTVRPVYNASYPNLYVCIQRINMSNVVTVTTPTLDKTTTVIDGGHITTGTISADYIGTGTLDASVVNVTNINADNISSGSISANRIGAGTIDASVVNVTNIDASNIKTGTLSGRTISGGTVSGAHVLTTANNKTAELSTATVSGQTIPFFGVSADSTHYGLYAYLTIAGVSGPALYANSVPLMLVAPSIRVADTTKNQAGTGYTGGIRVCYPVDANGNSTGWSGNASGWAWGTLTFVNGILTNKSWS